VVVVVVMGGGGDGGLTGRETCACVDLCVGLPGVCVICQCGVLVFGPTLFLPQAAVLQSFGASCIVARRHNVLMSLAVFNPISVEIDPDLQIVVSDWDQKREPSTGQVQ
jgi:hypothetical protein